MEDKNIGYIENKNKVACV